MSETFTFTHAGKEYSIPAMAALPIGVLRKARKGADRMDQTFIILETVMGEDSEELSAIDTMTAEQFNAWFEAWSQGAPVGESSDS